MKTPEELLKEHRFYRLVVQVVRTEQGLNRELSSQEREYMRCHSERICYNCKTPLGQLMICTTCGTSV